MSLLDKADISEQTAHERRTETGTIPVGKCQPVKPQTIPAYCRVPTQVVPYRHAPTYTYHGKPSDERPRGDVVYFMYCAGRIKIGVTNGIDQRQAALTGGSPFPPVTILIVDGLRKAEAALHKRFAADRLHGEWFTLSRKLRTFLILRLCDIGRAAFDRAEAEFVQYCEGVAATYKRPKRKPRPVCSHGKPMHQACFRCERAQALERLAEIETRLGPVQP
jgi:hypothetical protein